MSFLGNNPLQFFHDVIDRKRQYLLTKKKVEILKFYQFFVADIITCSSRDDSANGNKGPAKSSHFEGLSTSYIKKLSSAKV